MRKEQEYPSEPELDADGNVLSAEDWLGNRFQVGDMVMYCISAGRGQMMAMGRVQKLRIREGSKTTWQYGPKTDSDPYGFKNRILVPIDKHLWVVEVQVLTERTSGHWGNERRTRPAWVNEMNITAIQGIEETLIGIRY